MTTYNQISRQLERKATKLVLSRHKEFSHLPFHDKEVLLIATRNKLEDFSLFLTLFFVISTSLFLLRFLLM